MERCCTGSTNTSIQQWEGRPYGALQVPETVNYTNCEEFKTRQELVSTLELARKAIENFKIKLLASGAIILFFTNGLLYRKYQTSTITWCK